MLNRISLFILLLSTAMGYLHARIIGEVRDSIGEPLAGAVVSLVQLPDSALIDAVSADSLGKFEFGQTVESNNYLLRASMIGYKPGEKSATGNSSVNIVLQSDATVLGELVVTTAQPTFKRALGKFIYTPNSVAKMASDSYDLLQYVPMIEKNGDDYKLSGESGLVIYINGKKPVMPQSMLSKYLASLPSWRVKGIEIWTNVPGYDKIVNMLIDRPEDGLLGNLSAKGTYNSSRFSESIGASLWYTNDRWQFGLNGAYGHGEYQSEVLSETENFETGNSNKLNNKFGGITNAYSASFSAEYQINDKSSIGVSAMVNDNNYNSNGRQSLSSFVDGETHESLVISRLHRPASSPAVGIKADYFLRLDNRGSNFRVNADYSRDKSENYKTWFNNDIVSQLWNSGTTQQGEKFSASLLKVLNSKSMLSVGYGLFASENQSFNDIDNVYDNFKVKELINSANVEYLYKINFGLSVNLGLNFKSSSRRGEAYGDVHIGRRTFNYLNPSATLTYDIGEKGDYISLEYLSATFNPVYKWLNPLKLKNTDISFTVGNPDLKPDRYHMISLRYNWRGGLFIRTYYQIINNGAIAYNSVDKNGIITTSYANIAKSRCFEFQAGYSKFWFKRWFFWANATLGNTNMKAHHSETNYDINKWDVSFILRNEIAILPQYKLNFSIDLELRSPSVSTSSLDGETNWTFSNSFTVSKQWGSDWYTEIVANNPFANRSSRTLVTNQFREHIQSMTYPGSFALTVRYTFGKKTVKQLNKSTTTGLNERNSESRK